MAKTTDILFDDTNDIACIAGDFVIGESTRQHQADLLSANEGEFKFDPLVGVGLYGFLDDENPSAMMRKVRIQFSQDGMTVNKAFINEKGNMEIDAEYK